MGDVAVEQTDQSRAKVFISYSRKDIAFADRLEAALKARGFEPLIDRTDIYAFEQWWERVEALITRADTVVFVLSPDAVASEVALREVAFAASLNKRFAPVVWRKVDDKLVPEALAKLNFIFFDDEQRFEHRADQLSEALRTDIAWIRQHTEFGDAARRWALDKEPSGLLLRSPVLERAERWVVARPSEAPAPTEETQRFIRRSRRAATRRRNALTRSLAVGLVLALALAGLAYWQRGIAVEQRGIAERNEIQAKEQRNKALLSQSQFLADVSNQLMRGGDAAGAALIAMEALPDGNGGIERPYLPEAELALWSARKNIKEVSILVGHISEVYSATFSPDGRYVVTASDDRSARIWDAQTAPTIAILEGHTKPVYSAAFSPDGRYVVTGGGDATIRVWDAHTGEVRGRIGFKNTEIGVLSVTFSPDGQRVLASVTGASSLLWDLGTGKLLAQFRGQMGRTAGAFSPDGQRIVTVLGKTAQIWDPNTGKMLMSLEGQESPVISAAFSPDGHRVVTASGNAAYIWDGTTGTKIVSLEGHTDLVSTAVFSADGKRVLTASADSTARIWNATTGKLELIVAGQKANGIPDYASEKHPLTRPVVLKLFGGTYSAAFSPDGKRVVLASWDKTARIFDLEEREDAAVIRIDGRAAYASFSPDGRQVAIASSELGRVNIWNIDTSQCTATLDVPSVGKLAFSPDGQRLLTVGGDTSSTARIWDLATNRTLMTIADESAGWSGSFSPDGLKILTAGKAVARIWDAATGTAIMSFHHGGIMSARFSQDGRRIITAGHDKTAAIWESNTGQRIRVLEHPQSVLRAAFSPDGRQIVTASLDGRVRIWDAYSGMQLMSFPVGGVLTIAAFSPDGQLIATGGEGVVGVWHAATGKLIRTLTAPGAMLDIEFSPDGRSLLSALFEQQVRIWPVASRQELIDQSKQFIRRCLTQNERRASYLDPEPPAWCIEMEKWPYQTPDWKDWLRFKRGDANPPLPDTPEWQSWRASHN